MTVLESFKDLFADPPPPLLILFPEIDAVMRAGHTPMVARITIGKDYGQYFLLPIPASSDREQAYTALQAHYADLYGPHVVIEVKHLSSTPEDDELGTVRHSAAVTAQCDHGLSMRICTVNVVTKRART